MATKHVYNNRDLTNTEIRICIVYMQFIVTVTKGLHHVFFVCRVDKKLGTTYLNVAVPFAILLASVALLAEYYVPWTSEVPVCLKYIIINIIYY